MEHSQIDFNFVGNFGETLFHQCFSMYKNARYTLKRPEKDLSKLIVKLEAVFFVLIDLGRKNEFDVDKIIEIPDSTGLTCFQLATNCSQRICQYILGRNIKINSITLNMEIPSFAFSELAFTMMSKGVNPFIINSTGRSQADLNPMRFEDEKMKSILYQFPRSIHFTIEDICCTPHCPVDCSSNYKKFFYNNGSLIAMTDQNRIGLGGFGSVFKGIFHGVEHAFKCVQIESIESSQNMDAIVSDFEKNISEIRIQIASAGSGVIVPEAYVLQQNQVQDQNGQWIAQNFNIYIYPLYDCNLFELHEKFFQNFTEEISCQIIHQCFIRRG